uniref:phosphofurin acidic cluster sorting protein 1-like isoform X2 n=1 Tax=Myxine glutinosa TaxID=7769 RepID=UPI00358E27D1
MAGERAVWQSPRPALSVQLFATWESDRSLPSCVPRMLTLTLDQLLLLKDLGKDLTSVVIAVKLQGSKRILRSSEIPVPAGAMSNAALKLTFSLQYPHFLKREHNGLQVLLQRKKHYKHRAFLGYRTLASGYINLSEVMQKPMEPGLVLALHGNPKDPARAAELRLRTLSSLPMDNDDISEPKTKAAGRSLDGEMYSEDDDESSSTEPDNSDEHGTDMFDMYRESVKEKTSMRRRLAHATRLGRQQNLKQKVVSLLRRFKVADESLELEDDTGDLELEGDGGESREDEEMFGVHVCAGSESSGEMDDASLRSCQKPTLRPYFDEHSSSDSQTELGSDSSGQQNPDGVTATVHGRASIDIFVEESVEDSCESNTMEIVRAAEGGGGRKGKNWHSKGETLLNVSPSHLSVGLGRQERSSSLRERPNLTPLGLRTSSLDNEPGCVDSMQKGLQDQITRALGPEDELPEKLILVSTTEWQGQLLALRLEQQSLPVVCTASPADLRATFACLITQIQRFCNSSAQTPGVLRVAVLGDLPYLHAVLQCYVRHLASRSTDWLSFMRFLVIPFGSHSVSHYLGCIDSQYASAFLDPAWQDLFSCPEPPPSEPVDVASRVISYLEAANTSLNLPVAEAMLTYRQHRRRTLHSLDVQPRDEESCQKFIPFISMVSVGIVEQNSTQGDPDEPIGVNPTILVSSHPPPAPSSPRDGLSTSTSGQSIIMGHSAGSCRYGEAMGLQIDYWTFSGSEKRREGERREVWAGGGPNVGGKTTLRSTFRQILVSRLPPSTEATTGPPSMQMTVVMQEKNKKGIFLGKKPREREGESRSQHVDGINRLICTAKQQHTMLRVIVDGVVWHDVKFFQLAAQWPTHVKYFPVALSGSRRLST